MKEDKGNSGGGPAFPCYEIEVEKQHFGLSLRDWFAGQATEEDIQDILQKSFGCGELPTRAEARMLFADTMLAAREVKP